MGLFDFLRREKPAMQKRSIRLATGEQFAEFLNTGYYSLADNAEVVAGCSRIAQLVGSMTIYLMANTSKGDKRIVNELSRAIDIQPNEQMTRATFIQSVVMNMLLYGGGNAIVFPHTKKGYLESLEPIAAERVSFRAYQNRADYAVYIDGVKHDPRDLLHFVFNPDPKNPWMGRGVTTALRPLVDNLEQAQATKKGFMNSKWKPSLIVKVDALTDEFASPEGRSKLLQSYIQTAKAGEPWLIPADQMSVEQVRPLSLNDLAINEATAIDKRTVAALLGVPAFVLGVGEYNAAEWNAFISNTIRPLAQTIEQEMTRKLLLSPKMYLMFNASKLYAYDLQQTSAVYASLYDKGIVSGNEVREKIGMQPRDGLDDLLILENYIPIEESGNQKKLKGETDE